MSANWNQVQVFRDLGDPVPGDPDHFDRVASYMSALASQATHVHDEFNSIMLRQASDRFSGQAAEAFRELVTDTTNVLNVVPGIARQISTTLSDHAWRLRELRRAADSALPRAQARWKDRNQADAENSQTITRLRSVRYQIAQVRASSDPAAQTQVVRLQSDERGLVSRSQQLVRRRDDADRDLNGLRHDYHSFVDQSNDLQKWTASRLDKQELWSMKDKEWWQKAGSAIVGWVSDVGTNFALLIEAAFEGDLEMLLWRLRDALDDILTVLTVVALVAAIFLSAGTLLPGLLFLFAGLKFITEAMIWKQGIADPLTGDTISAGDLAWSGASFVMAGVGLGHAQSAVARIGKPFTPTRPISRIASMKSGRFGEMVTRRSIVTQHSLTSRQVGLRLRESFGLGVRHPQARHYLRAVDAGAELVVGSHDRLGDLSDVHEAIFHPTDIRLDIVQRQTVKMNADPFDYASPRQRYLISPGVTY